MLQDGPALELQNQKHKKMAQNSSLSLMLSGLYLPVTEYIFLRPDFIWDQNISLLKIERKEKVDLGVDQRPNTYESLESWTVLLTM